MSKKSTAVTIRLNAFLFDSSLASFETFLQAPYRTAQSYDLAATWGIEGKIFVKESKGKRPRWAEHLDALHASEIPNLETLSASAVLLLKAGARTVAFVFGYGRYLLDDAEMVSDFGIKTALNTLDNKHCEALICIR